MKLSFNLKTVTTFLKKRTAIVLWIALAIVLLLVGLVIKGSAETALQARTSPVGVQAQIVRVNFDLYNQIEKHLKDGLIFVPKSSWGSPFGLPGDKTP